MDIVLQTLILTAAISATGVFNSWLGTKVLGKGRSVWSYRALFFATLLPVTFTAVVFI